MIVPLEHKIPTVSPLAFLAPDCWIIGDVTLADEASVFFGSVLRGDIQPITIGARTNLQDQCIIHSSGGRSPVIIGEDTTVGHRATIHGARVGNRCLVGMGAILLDDAVIEDEAIVAAGALVKEGMRVPSRTLVMGIPAKVVRELTNEELAFLKKSADHYVEKALMYRKVFSEN